MRREASLFFRSLAVILLIVFALDYAIGNVMRNGFRCKPLNDDPYSLTWFFYNEAKADVIILGNSRALHNYNPKIISDSLGFGVKNIAMDGTSAIYQSCILRKMIERHKPKVVFFEYLESYIDGHANNLENQDYLKDLYYKDSFVRSRINDVDAYSPIKELSFIYRLTGLNSLNFITNLRGKGLHEYMVKGYKPLIDVGYAHPVLSYRNYIAPKVDPIEYRSIIDIISMCKKNGIKLIFTIAPTCNLTYPKNSATLHKICEKYNVPVIDNSNVPGISSNMFKDDVHMTVRGANKYTIWFIKQVKDVF